MRWSGCWRCGGTPRAGRWRWRCGRERLCAARRRVRGRQPLGCPKYSGRVIGHALSGCFVFGAFAAKMLLLRAGRLPDRPLPVGSGLVRTASTAAADISVGVLRTVGVTT
ncbi:DUF6529 family protein [Actinacidiphila sp. bgisy167]|uniref:DUF6529 family protein n=1 Tax=Actinacidiphila sp. bgisy167 TaxID=3413797 RepID=UPI003D743FD6